MAGFLYFLTGKAKYNQVTLAEAQEMGLGYAFSKNVPSRESKLNGVSGYVFADEKRLGEFNLGIYPDEQVWRLVPGRKDGLQIGYYKAAPPTPADLVREAALDGYKVRLGEHEWTVPLVRDYDAQAGVSRSALPCYLDLDENGEVCQGEVLGLYKHLWDLTEEYANSMLGGEDAEGAGGGDG